MFVQFIINMQTIFQVLVKTRKQKCVNKIIQMMENQDIDILS